MKPDTCPFCGAVISKHRGDFHFDFCGLPNVWLEDVQLETCSGCEDGGGVAISAPFALQSLLAEHVIRQKYRLTNIEIRFLRKHIEWSSKKLAARLGVQPETTSRWEAGTLNMSECQDRLLRLYVAAKEPFPDFTIFDTENLQPRSEPPPPIKVRFDGTRWTPPVVFAVHPTAG